ncbi:DUF3040 domain-containing protein [Streptomyces sp. 7R007]
MNVERELAQIERRLAKQDPQLATRLGTFEQIAAPRHRRCRNRPLTALVAAVCLMLATASVVVTVWAAVNSPPPRAVQQSGR